MTLDAVCGLNGIAWFLHAVFPALPVHVLLAEAIVIALTAGVDLAVRAAQMDPVEVLRTE